MVISNEQLLDAVVNSVDAAIMMIDKNLKVVMCNKMVEEFFGIKQSLILGQDKRESITKYIKWQAEDPEAFQEKLFWLYENLEVVSNDEVELVIPRKRTLHRFSGPVYDNKNKLIGRVEVYNDITYAKKLQEESDFKNEQFALLNIASSSISKFLEIGIMCSCFLEKIIDATKAIAGSLYVESEEQMECVASVGMIKNKKNIKIDEIKKIKKVRWGSIKNSEFFSNKNDDDFYIAFPARSPNMDINGVGILIWEKLEEKWLNEDLFKNIGLYLGIGISNNKLYEETRRAAILQERDRIAMEMHDGLAQTLGYLGLGLDSIFERVQKNKDKEEILQLIERLRMVVDGSYADVREAIIGLRVNILNESSFYVAVKKYLKEFKSLTKITTTTNIQEDMKEPDFESQLHIMRIIQEATTNVRRHSNATNILVKMSENERNLSLVIEDNGQGFDKEENIGGFSALHQGIKIMHQRAKLLKGELVIDTSKGRGTRVSLEIPVKLEEE